ncbi:MAG: hypothetical protein WC783_03950 [Candidatus Paceibacterota bacterium]|jgi:hypothetical protein
MNLEFKYHWHESGDPSVGIDKIDEVITVNVSINSDNDALRYFEEDEGTTYINDDLKELIKGALDRYLIDSGYIETYEEW